MDSDRPAHEVPRLIALHAADYGGKDTAGKLIEEVSQPLVPDTWVPFASRGFAVKVKESIAAAFGIPADEAVEWCDMLKQDGVVVVVEDKEAEFPVDHSTTGRQFIRDFATAGHRDLFDPNFWVNVLLPERDEADLGAPDWHNRFDCAAFCVITDLRFNTEADRVWDLGGEVWALTGRGEPFDDEHLSNGDFKWRDADHVLDNSGPIEQLRAQIQTLV